MNKLKNDIIYCIVYCTLCFPQNKNKKIIIVRSIPNLMERGKMLCIQHGDLFINFIFEPIRLFGRNLIFISIEIPIFVDFVGGIVNIFT